MVAVGKKGRSTFNLWPAILKFKIGPQKFKEICVNVAAVTDGVDLFLLTVIAFAVSPVSTFLQQRWTAFFDDDDDDAEDTRKRTRAKKAKGLGDGLKKFGILTLLHQFARVALAVYVVDVVTVILTTLGFTFPTKWLLAESFSKFACT